MTRARSLLELVIVMSAILAASFTASLSGENIGRGEAQRTGKGAATGITTAGACLAAYKLFRGT